MIQPSSDGGPLWRRWLPLVVLLAAAYALFANTFANDWTLDDLVVIVNNPDVQSLKGFWADSYPGRPLRELSFLLDHAFFGLRPAGWHIQSIFWHGLNAYLVFLLLRRLRLGSSLAWIAALVFLAHPLQVEVVANVANRKDSLALSFILLSVLAYGEAFRRGGRRAPWIALALVLTLVALLAKQNAIVLPLVYAAYELAFVPSPERLLMRRPRAAAVAVALLFVAGLAWYWGFGGRQMHMQAMPEVMAKMNKSFSGESIQPYFLLMFKSWGFMFCRLVFPFDLGPEYVFPAPRGWGDPWVAATLAGVGAYLVALLLSLRRKPVVFFALSWLGLFWLPTSNLWPLAYFAADRYLYTPSVGFCLLVALLLGSFRRVPTVVGGGLAFVLVAFLAVLTWQQNGVWRSNETLWTQAARVNPESTTALNNLGMVYMQQKEWGRALEPLQKAAANFNDPMPYYNLGQVYENQGDLEKAVANYRLFLAFNDPQYRQLASQLRQRLYLRHGVVLR